MRRQRILISSVMQGYEDRRDAAAEAISACGFEPVLAEALPAQAGAPRDVILNDAIAGCAAVVGVYGPRYGWTGSQSGISPTEEEYDRARELFKPIYVFIDGMAGGNVEPQQQAFLDKVQNWDVGVMRRTFGSLSALQQQIQDSLTGSQLSPRYRRFLDRLVIQARNINGNVFREETEPFVPGFDFILHQPASQFTAGVDSYIIVINGDLYDRDQVSRAIANWGSEANRLIGAGFWKARGTSTTALVVIEDNPHTYQARMMQRNRRLFASNNFDEMLVDLSRATVELPPRARAWFNPLKKAVEASL